MGGSLGTAGGRIGTQLDASVRLGCTVPGVKFAVAPGACRPYSEIFAVISEKIRFSVLIGLKTH